jgi:primosomal protein N'
MNEFAKIVIPGIAIDTEFDYAVPASLRAQIRTGQLVSVSFGRANEQGVVTQLLEKSAYKKVKEISGISGSEPAIDEIHLRLTRWIADHYFCSWGEALESCLISPPGKRAKAAPERERSESVAELPGLLDEDSSRVLEQLRSGLAGNVTKPVLFWGGLTSQRMKIYLELVDNLVNSGRQVLIISR